MMVHLFGVTSSPSCANFGLWQAAEDNQQEFSKNAVDRIKSNLYVDDYLTSVSSENKTTVLVDELREQLSKRGFRLTKWISNSRNVIKYIAMSERAGSVKCEGCSPRLGVTWDDPILAEDLARWRN